MSNAVIDEEAPKTDLYITLGERDLTKNLVAQNKLTPEDLDVMHRQIAEGNVTRREFRDWLNNVIGRNPSEDEKSLVEALFAQVAHGPGEFYRRKMLEAVSGNEADANAPEDE